MVSCRLPNSLHTASNIRGDKSNSGILENFSRVDPYQFQLQGKCSCIMYISVQRNESWQFSRVGHSGLLNATEQDTYLGFENTLSRHRWHRSQASNTRPRDDCLSAEYPLPS